MSGVTPASSGPRVGFLGPEGTFTEQALLSQPDLAACELVALPSIPDVLTATDSGEVDLGFIGIENSIEGAVTVTVDALAFEHDLFIQREVVLGVQVNLLAPSGVGLGDIRRVLSMPVATAQCRSFLHRELPGAESIAVSSTAEAARLVAGDENDGHTAAVAPSVAAKLYGLDIVANDIEDHPDNATRFVWLAAVGAVGDPGPEAKTSIVFWGGGDQSPGWLVDVLREFSDRGVNLTRIESRPRRVRLGHYMFFADLEGAATRPPVSEALGSLRGRVEEIRILGSYGSVGGGAGYTGRHHGGAGGPEHRSRGG
jgi:prephenate dehydratase